MTRTIEFRSNMTEKSDPQNFSARRIFSGAHMAEVNLNDVKAGRPLSYQCPLDELGAFGFQWILNHGRLPTVATIVDRQGSADYKFVAGQPDECVLVGGTYYVASKSGLRSYKTCPIQ